MSARRVHFCPGDDAGWAIDTDLRLTRAALEGLLEPVDRPEEAEVVHAVWWWTLREVPASVLEGRTVICHMAGEPARCLADPVFASVVPRVDLWIAQSRGAERAMRAVFDRVAFVPYAVDEPEVWRTKAAPSEPVRRALGEIRPGEYIIANFNRDTEGAGLASGEARAKWVKGPDVFVEILAAVRERGHSVRALLAGPRRHWLRARLAERGVPASFAGEAVAGDDYPANILPPDQLALLYQRADLVLCTSRSEGGPRGVLEAAASGTAVLSSRVGLAPDLLPPEALFGDVAEAVERIEHDIGSGGLRRFVPMNTERVRALHSMDANRERWARVYAELPAGAPPRRALRSAPKVKRDGPVVSLWNHFQPPPWGGGNQFMLALEAGMKSRGIVVTRNGEGPAADAHIVNSVQFPAERFRESVDPARCRVVHRIDGPISMIRRTPESMEQDRACFEFNSQFACATVLQSWYTLESLRSLGFLPVRPLIIKNAVNPAIFFAAPAPRPLDGPLRIVASSWSDNPMKGAPIYRWMDEHLDPARYAFTFVGRCAVPLKRATVVAPLPSDALAELLRTQHVYITASRSDPCSNALLEALACGLPALYFDDGGHGELSQFGGLPFRRPEEIPALLDRLRQHRDAFRALIRVPTLDEVTSAYLALALSGEAYR